MADDLLAVLMQLEEERSVELDQSEVDRLFAAALERARMIPPRPRRSGSARPRGPVLPSARPCVVCGDEFTAKRIDARHCKDRCRMRAYRARSRQGSPSREG